jgi:hypothetical protein
VPTSAVTFQISNTYLHTTEKSCHHSTNCIDPFCFHIRRKRELFPVRQCQIGFYNWYRYCLLCCNICVSHWHNYPPSVTSSQLIMDYFVFLLAKKRGCLCRNLFSIRGEFSLICIPNFKSAYHCYFIGFEWIFLSPAEDASVLRKNKKKCVISC